MVMRGEGLVEDSVEEPAMETKNVYVLHPNCAVEEL